MIKNKGDISIGENVTINSDFLSNLSGMFQRTVIVARNGGRISIGNNVGISGATIYARDSVTIGDNTLIGANAKIFDNDFHPLDSNERISNNEEAIKVKPVRIGQNVFIGCNAIILKGAEIGDNTIVGAGSVVTGKFPSNCVIAGNPARIVKEVLK